MSRAAMRDRDYDAVIISLLRGALLAIGMGAGLALYSCGGDNDESITDCSRRNQPQHYDGSKWTCKDR
jgi:hypothetical protein